MRRLYTLTAILVFLATAIGCESCFTRGARAPQPVPTYVAPCETGCPTGCATPAGCSSCGGAPTIGTVQMMPGPAQP